MKNALGYMKVLILLALIISLAACSTVASPSLQETQVSLYVEQTVVARDIAVLTQNAGNPAPVQLQPVTTEAPANPPAPAPTEQSQEQPASSSSSFDSWVSSAKILLYEDAAGTNNRTRWISDALQELNLNYYDAVDQIGLFQSQLSSDQTWDLIIYAREDRNNDAGNLFGEIFDEYDNGSSVIIEHWNLDDVANFSSALTSKMSRCGFSITADWFDPNGSADLMLYAHNTQNPIHSQPNGNIRLTSFNTIRWTGDIGDLLRIQPGGEGQILYGISESNSASKGTVISCFENRFILQTHATHQYERDRMIYLWENYIYNALLARYSLLN